jgi:DNA-binding NarL/FixJ family response regulator
VQILIADDHPIVRTGLMQILSKVDGYEVVGEVGDEKQVLAWLKARAVDLLLLDVSARGDLFLEALARIRSSYPATRVLVLTPEPDNPYAIRSLRLGADGCLSKGCSPDELIDAVETVANGGRHVSPGHAQAVADGDARTTLSNRELEVLGLLGSGKRVRDVASTLRISPKTVSTYRTRLLKKLGLGTTADLIRFAVENGVIPTLLFLGSAT